MVKVLIILVVLARIAATSACGQDLSNDFDRGAVFDEISSIVEKRFYDKNFDSDEWRARALSFREKAVKTNSRDQFSAIVNDLLQTLDASHTYYFSKLNPRHYQLLGIFDPDSESKDEVLSIYEGIGLDTRVVDGETYVSAVYDGLPAANAGLRFGDRIQSVARKPFHPILSFKGKADSTVPVEIMRDGKKLTVDVQVQFLDGRTMFEKAMLFSARVIERDGKKIGYVHAWSYAGAKYQEHIRSLIIWGKLRQCDGLVLDLRDGWGGANLDYLNLFRPAVLNVQSSSRTKEAQNFTGVWGKPVSLLTNDRTTSGKELFACGFKKLKLGQIIGETTAGAVVAGGLFLLKNGDVLYLAITDIKVDGKRLEGVGVEPDIKVERPIRNAGKTDPQLERAVELLVESIND